MRGDPSFLNCPRSGPSIRRQVGRPPREHCPACLAHSRGPVERFVSTLSADELYDAALAPPAPTGEGLPAARHR